MCALKSSLFTMQWENSEQQSERLHSARLSCAGWEMGGGQNTPRDGDGMGMRMQTGMRMEKRMSVRMRMGLGMGTGMRMFHFPMQSTAHPMRGARRPARSLLSGLFGWSCWPWLTSPLPWSTLTALHPSQCLPAPTPPTLCLQLRRSPSLSVSSNLQSSVPHDRTLPLNQRTKPYCPSYPAPSLHPWMLRGIMLGAQVPSCR